MRARTGRRDSLPTWVTNQIDALIGSGVLKADQLDNLGPDELCELARRYVRRTAPPDLRADLAAVREGA